MSSATLSSAAAQLAAKDRALLIDPHLPGSVEERVLLERMSPDGSIAPR